MAAVPWTNNRVWRGKGSWLPVIFSSRLTCVLSVWVSPPNRPKRHKFIHGLIVVDPESSSNVQSTSGQPIIQTTHITNQILSLDVKNLNEKKTSFQWQFWATLMYGSRSNSLPSHLSLRRWPLMLWSECCISIYHVTGSLHTLAARGPWTHSPLVKSRTMCQSKYLERSV